MHVAAGVIGEQGQDGGGRHEHSNRSSHDVGSLSRLLSLARRTCQGKSTNGPPVLLLESLATL
jgi:hypothetical protein